MLLTNENAATLDTLSLSAQAKARISVAITQGDLVMVPAQEILIGGIQTSSWLDIEPTTGEVSGVLEDGVRSALDDYTADLLAGISQLASTYAGVEVVATEVIAEEEAVPFLLRVFLEPSEQRRLPR